MSNSTRLKGNISLRGKRRLVTKTKWELPHPDSKPYWDKICHDIESRVAMTVRNPSSSTPILRPFVLPPSIRYSAASSVSSDVRSAYDFSKRHLLSETIDSTGSQSIIEEPKSSSSSPNPVISTKLSRDHITVSQDLLECANDRYDSSRNHCRLTKLSKITRLFNDFLSSTRTRVRPITARSKKFSLPTKRSSENNRDHAWTPMSAKFYDPRSKDDSSESKSRTGSMMQKESKDIAGTFEGTIVNKKSVGFRDNLEETIEKDSDQKGCIVDVTNPRRARAPSLSVASAIPSFGKVVISIEDIDSTVNEEEHDKSFDPTNHVKSKDYRKMIEPDETKVDNGRPTRDFLKVPQARPAGSASYPTRDGSKYRQQNESNETSLTEEAYESKLRRETRVLEKIYPFWPKRSIVHVFQALKTMKNGLRSKARIESEINRFFAAPLDVYSPRARSSMSSDDQTEWTDSNVPKFSSEQKIDEIMYDGKNDGNESSETIDGESNSSSYASVRERLMRVAGTHLSKDSKRDAAGKCIDKDNALEVKSEEANPSSFYNSWATSKNDIVEKQRNKKTVERHFIGIPRVSRIFPRVKADKCLACMSQSLGDIDQPRRRKTPGTFFDYEISKDSVLRDDELPLEILGFDFPIESSFDQFHRKRYQAPLPTGKTMTKSFAGDRPARSSIVDSPKDQVLTTGLVDSGNLNEESSDIGSMRTTSQINDPHRSHTLVKSASKTLTSAKSLITSLALMSERSRSISDQDDSDQGCIDPGGNDIGIGGGSTSKYLAPCHMPINLKPSLEPLKALRSKKSRSIRSRVTSAEKSGVSGNDDDDDSDYEEEIERRALNEAKEKLDADRRVTKLETVSSPRGEKNQMIDIKKDENVPGIDLMDVNLTQSVVASQENISSKIDIDFVKNDFCDNAPIISDREVIEISAKCLDRNMTIIEILRVLANEYSNRLSDRLFQRNRSSRLTKARKNEKIGLRLLTLLVDSKNYVNREKRSNDPLNLSISSEQPGLCNSRQLRRILPLKSYNLVAPILGMEKWYPSQKIDSLREVARRTTRINAQERSRKSDFDLIVHPSSVLEQNVSFEKGGKDSRSKLSPYSLFLMKPRRKVRMQLGLESMKKLLEILAVTWRPLTERDLEGYDPEATLKMRATKITDGICEDFCRWLDSLAAGTNQINSIDVEVLKDMFETDFTAEVCSTMQLFIKEMPMVPTAVAIARNCPGAGELALTRGHLVKDARAETSPKRTVGFGTSLPVNLKFVPPRNRVDEKWLQCENVPKDLETMEAVWKGITHLTSVKGFVKWLRAHPEVKRPDALENVLQTRKTFDTRKSMVNDFKNMELDLDQIQNLKVDDNTAATY